MNQPNDTPEPSLASAGSRPVAWAVVQSECWSVYQNLLDANRAATHGLGELVPLYRAPQPSLTGKEREAVQQAIDSGYGMEDAEPWALETLRELLKRLG